MPNQDDERIPSGAAVEFEGRRMRFATKGPAVMPQKILTDHAWADALTNTFVALRNQQPTPPLDAEVAPASRPRQS